MILRHPVYQRVKRSQITCNKLIHLWKPRYPTYAFNAVYTSINRACASRECAYACPSLGATLFITEESQHFTIFRFTYGIIITNNYYQLIWNDFILGCSKEKFHREFLRELSKAEFRSLWFNGNKQLQQTNINSMRRNVYFYFTFPQSLHAKHRLIFNHWNRNK